MSLVVVDEGKIILLQDLLAGLGTDADVHLYQNDYTPVHGSNLSNFTECTFDGYVFKTADPWTVSGTLDVANRAWAQAQTMLWSLGVAPATGNQVYGYYVTLPDEVTVIWAERFDGAPFPMTEAGDFVGFKPIMTLRSEFLNS
jgi:hypothetical protein